MTNGFPERLKNSLEPIILELLGKTEYISGNTFYDIISKRLHQSKHSVSVSTYESLDNLVNSGKIIRYKLDKLPDSSNFELKRLIDANPEYVYTLPLIK
jgi:hypothetical protein